MSPTPKISGSIICKTNKQWIYFSTTLTPSYFRRYDECWITGILQYNKVSYFACSVVLIW